MAGISQMLSWLFGRKSEEEPEEERERAPAQSQEEAAQTASAASTASAAPTIEQEAEIFRLTLPPDHAVRQLWRQWQDTAGRQPAPLFSLKGPDGDGEAVAAAQARQELARLLLTVNASGNQRLAKAIPKNSGNADKDAEPPPPVELDACAVAVVSTDRLAAWVFAYPPVGGGKELDREMLSQALKEKQVVFGLNEALLDAIPSRPDRYFCLYLAAQGQPAAHGKDGRIVDMFKRKVERELTVDEYNRVDYASINFIQNVDEGAVICRIIAPTPGEPGKTVLGQELPTRDGIPATVPKGRNTTVNEAGDALIATKTGHVEFNGRTFQVKPVMDIDGNVDYSTGHINFLGDVHVHGDVCTGFTVRAMGNITIDGVVEAATVEAGGDLVMVKGAQGDNRAVLRASHSIYAKYLENCCVYAMEDLHADCIINCDVYCDGLVDVCSGRGTIIGGSIRAAHEVTVSVLGSRGEAPTDVVLGGLPCEEFDHEVLVREVAGLEEELDKIQRQPDSPTKFSRAGKLRIQLSLSKNKLEQFDRDLEEQKENPGDPGVRRLTCSVAYPGASVSIGPGIYRFRQETRPVVASLVGEEICVI